MFLILQERVSLIVPWIVGLITFMALEAVAVVYSNVLRDHVNKVSWRYNQNLLYRMQFAYDIRTNCDFSSSRYSTWHYSLTARCFPSIEIRLVLQNRSDVLPDTGSAERKYTRLQTRSESSKLRYVYLRIYFNFYTLAIC